MKIVHSSMGLFKLFPTFLHILLKNKLNWNITNGLLLIQHETVFPMFLCWQRFGRLETFLKHLDFADLPITNIGDFSPVAIVAAKHVKSTLLKFPAENRSVNFHPWYSHFLSARYFFPWNFPEVYVVPSFPPVKLTIGGSKSSKFKDLGNCRALSLRIIPEIISLLSRVLLNQT